MPHERELDYQRWLEDAEQAASAGDLARAETLLREAARAQEDHLGTAHPDLASTFNNLGIVCEQNGHLGDAEAFYRRAFAIATAVAGPTDPLVETAARNLRDFCQANGRPLEDWPGIVEPAATAVPESAAESTPPPPPRAPAPAHPAAPPQRPATGPSRPARGAPAPAPAAAATPGPSRPPVMFLVALAAAALLATAVVAGLWQPWGGENADTTDAASRAGAAPPAEERAPTAAPADGAASQAAAPPGTPMASAPAAAAPSPSTPPEDRASPRATPAPPAAAAPPPPPPAPEPGVAAAPDVRVVTAGVCASLSPAAGWRCTPLEDATADDSASYFTRVASASPLQIQHLWYADGRLVRSTRLSIGASPTEGYRTYSRQRLWAGRWRVELRTVGGALLHEAAFDVRP